MLKPWTPLLLATLALVNFGVFAPGQLPAANIDPPKATALAKTPESVLADIQNILPGNWICKLTTNPGDVVAPYNFQVVMRSPAFYLDFTNPAAAQLGVFVFGMRPTPFNPSLRLFFYAEPAQSALLTENARQGMDVLEIGRLPGYRVFVNSEWVNGGFSGGPLTWSIAPMGRALEAYFGRLPEGKMRDSLGLGEDSAEKLKGPYGFSGRVVDGQTGRPIPQFYLNWLAGDPNIPAAEVNLATGMKMYFDGIFACDADPNLHPGTELPLKIFAPGYAPAPLSPAPIVSPVRMTNLLVRMRRGGTLRGRLLDSSHQPLVGVCVYLLGWSDLEYDRGRVIPFRGNETVTDAGGQFTFSGAGEPGEQLAVFFERRLSQFSISSNLADEQQFVLPEPVKLVFNIELPDDADQQDLGLRLFPGSSIINASDRFALVNHSQFVLTNVEPGFCEIFRVKHLPVNVNSGVSGVSGSRFESSGEAVLDAVTAELAPGEIRTFDFTRTNGSSITGGVTGADELRLRQVFVYLCTTAVTNTRGYWSPFAGAQPTTLDATSCDSGNHFATARVLPGTYNVWAEGFRNPCLWGAPSHCTPDAVGMTTITVPATGAVPSVTIHLEPYSNR